MRHGSHWWWGVSREPWQGQWLRCHHSSGREGEVQKNLESLTSLKQILRETCDSVHSDCTYCPGEEDKERGILYVRASVFSYTGQELWISRDGAASNDFLHVELIVRVHTLRRLTGIICRKLCLWSYLEKIGYYNLPHKIHPAFPSEVCQQVQTSHIK